jgi:hypothetical protein
MEVGTKNQKKSVNAGENEVREWMEGADGNLQRCLAENIENEQILCLKILPQHIKKKMRERFTNVKQSFFSKKISIFVSCLPGVEKRNQFQYSHTSPYLKLTIQIPFSEYTVGICY